MLLLNHSVDSEPRSAVLHFSLQLDMYLHDHHQTNRANRQRQGAQLVIHALRDGEENDVVSGDLLIQKLSVLSN